MIINMNKKVLFFFLLLGVISALVSCYNDNLSELTPSTGVSGGSCDTTGVVTYSNQIVAVLKTNCGINNSCHSSRNTSGYDLSSYEGVKAVVISGKLISSITWSGSATRMPENGSKMNACNITKIQKWIDDGANNN
jgi:hypothetical protein